MSGGLVVAAIAFIMYLMKKRGIIVNTTGGSANECFLDKESNEETTPTMTGIPWRLWPNEADGKKVEDITLELSPVMAGSSSTSGVLEEGGLLK
jgi:hypothetical protein